MDSRQEFQQPRLGDVNPKVHGVRYDKPRQANLVEHVVLQIGGDIGQEHDWRVSVSLGNAGEKCSKTFKETERVSRIFRSHMYSPDQRNVFPGTICSPVRSMLRSLNS